MIASSVCAIFQRRKYEIIHNKVKNIIKRGDKGYNMSYKSV